jgi:hypothetical protein
LPRSAKLLLCKLAFCLAFGEPALLSGPTCFKAYCVQLLGRSLRLEADECGLNVVFLSQLTEKGDLEGSIEPHNLQSWCRFLQSWCRCLAVQAAAAPPDSRPPRLVGSTPTVGELREILAWHADRIDALPPNRRSNARYCKVLLRELDAFERSAQGFPFVERGVLRSVRFGGVLFLRDYNLPDQAATQY